MGHFLFFSKYFQIFCFSTDFYEIFTLDVLCTTESKPAICFKISQQTTTETAVSLFGLRYANLNS
jgi:hypothetical protein